MEQKDNIKKSTELLSENMRKIDQEIENLKTQNNLNEEQIKAVKAGVLETFAKISLMSAQQIATTYSGEETRLNNILLKDVTDKCRSSTGNAQEPITVPYPCRSNIFKVGRFNWFEHLQRSIMNNKTI